MLKALVALMLLVATQVKAEESKCTHEAGVYYTKPEGATMRKITDREELRRAFQVLYFFRPSEVGFYTDAWWAEYKGAVWLKFGNGEMICGNFYFKPGTSDDTRRHIFGDKS